MRLAWLVYIIRNAACRPISLQVRHKLVIRHNMPMPRIVFIAISLFTISLDVTAFERGASGQVLPATGTVQVAFPTEDDANALIVQALRDAKKSVLVQAFSFTSNEIAFALIEAKRRMSNTRARTTR
jgi:hypothetical protein